MKKSHITMVGFLLVLGCATSPERLSEKDLDPAFYLSSASSRISAEDIQKIKNFVAINLAVQLEDFSAHTEPGNLNQLADRLAGQVPDRAVALVALVDPRDGPATHSVYRYDDRVALIHVPAVTEGVEGDQAYYRVERLVMRALAFMTGFEHSPDPFSVMTPYRTLEDLDRRGRNFSPPDTFKFQKRAREMGVPLLENSPFYMAPKDQ